jgi:hypothetical protein
MEKLIIENRSNLKMEDAINYARQVITQGRISESHKGKQYCFCTWFQESDIVVYADMNKQSDRLIICSERRANAI